MTRAWALIRILLPLLATLAAAQDSHNPIFFINPVPNIDSSNTNPLDYPVYKWGSTVDIKWSASASLGLSLVIFQNLPNEASDYVYLFRETHSSLSKSVIGATSGDTDYSRLQKTSRA
jgi:hypothetical protein